MIKPIILSLAAATTLAACNVLEKESVPMTGMPNPASEFCVKQGGKLEIKKTRMAESMECAICLTVPLWKSGRISVNTTNKQQELKRSSEKYFQTTFLYAEIFAIR